MSDSRLLSSRKAPGSLARRIGLAAMVGPVMFATVASLDAEARRMGGGRSFGRQQSSTMQRQTTPPAQPSQPTQQSAQAAQAQRAQPAPAPAATPNRSRWLGPIAGLAAGLGIAALLSHFGLGEAFAGAMANMLVIAAIAMLAIWLIRRFVGRKRDAAGPEYAGSAPSLNARRDSYAQEPSFTPAQSSPSFPPQVSAPVFGAPGGYAAQSAPVAPAVPAGFDSEAFIRNAKVYFVRLQAAWDVRNIEDIREFTTPEMFAEVKVDLDARGAEQNLTDVVQLNADLLGVEDRGNEYFASVRFSGLIRETAGAPAEPFAEIWNLSRANRAGEGWLLAGIQQIGETAGTH
ncbi:Tim44 domain-containing protein [Paraburkholderia sp. DHOC27]|uniref:Tim44 domain-containing protein n=1 Tax=Paraburkholderia sp. DHOC27 TaxID=2303330 RepID=UPI000E3D909B|nr:TIM44-like domain-containing protein [Paraburkholderia sp. DHOC27]RFU47021.1 Tim44 domain-containing protein [Paraburkholderia sp. DHOC27]